MLPSTYYEFIQHQTVNVICNQINANLELYGKKAYGENKEMLSELIATFLETVFPGEFEYFPSEFLEENQKNFFQSLSIYGLYPSESSVSFMGDVFSHIASKSYAGYIEHTGFLGSLVQKLGGNPKLKSAKLMEVFYVQTQEFDDVFLRFTVKNNPDTKFFRIAVKKYFWGIFLLFPWFVLSGILVIGNTFLTIITYFFIVSIFLFFASKSEKKDYQLSLFQPSNQYFLEKFDSHSNFPKKAKIVFQQHTAKKIASILKKRNYEIFMHSENLILGYDFLQSGEEKNIFNAHKNGITIEMFLDLYYELYNLKNVQKVFL